MDSMFDDRELRKFADDLQAAPKKIEKPIDDLAETHAQRIAAAARAAAPKGRPWLSTPEGLRVVKAGEMDRRIVSPRDPRGESVGYRVEWGTSIMAPRPFLIPAARAGRKAFFDDVNAVLEKALQ